MPFESQLLKLGPISHRLATVHPWPTDVRTDDRLIVP